MRRRVFVCLSSNCVAGFASGRTWKNVSSSCYHYFNHITHKKKEGQQKESYDVRSRIPANYLRDFRPTEHFGCFVKNRILLISSYKITEVTGITLDTQVFSSATERSLHRFCWSRTWSVAGGKTAKPRRAVSSCFPMPRGNGTPTAKWRVSLVNS